MAELDISGLTDEQLTGVLLYRYTVLNDGLRHLAENYVDQPLLADERRREAALGQLRLRLASVAKWLDQYEEFTDALVETGELGLISELHELIRAEKAKKD